MNENTTNIFFSQIIILSQKHYTIVIDSVRHCLTLLGTALSEVEKSGMKCRQLRNPVFATTYPGEIPEIKSWINYKAYLARMRI